MSCTALLQLQNTDLVNLVDRSKVMTFKMKSKCERELREFMFVDPTAR